jgi:hypothetical protein
MQNRLNIAGVINSKSSARCMMAAIAFAQAMHRRPGRRFVQVQLAGDSA